MTHVIIVFVNVSALLLIKRAFNSFFLTSIWNCL